MNFKKTIDPVKINNIRKGLLAGLLVTNCIFCRWGVQLLIKDLTTHNAAVDLSVFNGDIVYATSCIEEVKQALPSCFVTKNIDDRFFLIKFVD